MEITLQNGRWYANGFVIVGNSDDGYYVYPKYNECEIEDGCDSAYLNEDFEKCLTWVYNS